MEMQHLAVDRSGAASAGLAFNVAPETVSPFAQLVPL